MDTIATYREKQRSEALFSLREGESSLLKFVQVGKANRINTAYQGALMVKLHGIFEVMGWQWGVDTIKHVEDLQTTCQSPHGAREMLLEAIQFTELAAHDRNKASFQLSGDGKK